jgi:hypothetical protein
MNKGCCRVPACAVLLACACHVHVAFLSAAVNALAESINATKVEAKQDITCMTKTVDQATQELKAEAPAPIPRKVIADSHFSLCRSRRCWNSKQLFLCAAVARGQGAGDGAGTLVAAQGCWRCRGWLWPRRDVRKEGWRGV